MAPPQDANLPVVVAAVGVAAAGVAVGGTCTCTAALASSVIIGRPTRLLNRRSQGTLWSDACTAERPIIWACVRMFTCSEHDRAEVTADTGWDVQVRRLPDSEHHRIDLNPKNITAFPGLSACVQSHTWVAGGGSLLLWPALVAPAGLLEDVHQ